MSICYNAPEQLLPFYLAWQINPKSSNYHLNFGYQFSDRATVDLVLEKVQHLISLRPYLRQTFALQGEILIATIHEHCALSIEFHSATDIEFYQLEQELIAAPFDLETTPPFRINVVHLRDEDAYFLLFTVHHIIMDGITLDAFISELNALLAMRDLCSHAAEQYIEQNKVESVLEKGFSNQLVSEYMLQIENMAFSLDMPIMRSSSPVFHYTATMPSYLTDKMISYCTLKTISPFNLLLSTYALFLTKLTDQKQMLIRYPVNTRADKSILGCFLNIVTFSLELHADWTYNHLVDHVLQKVVILKSMAKMYFQNRSHIANSIPSFSSLTVAALDPLVIREIHYDARSYPQLGHGFISMKYRQKKNQFCFVCDILQDIYPEYFTDSILDRFFYFFEAVLDFPDTVLKKIDLVFPEEREKLLVEWNTTDVAYPQNKTLVDWFVESVRQFPDKIALKSSEGTMTYAELNQRSENIASYLLAQGVQTEELVGILIDHRFEMITALFGVLKAGAAYVPIPHNAPAERIASLIKDSSMRFLLTISEWLHLVGTQVKKIDIAEIQVEYRRYCQPYIDPRQLAYVIYTSGTTGTPKGIAIEQHSVVNYVHFLIRTHKLDSFTIGSKYIGFGFDVSVAEIYPILFVGASLFLINEGDRYNLEDINYFLIENKVTYACFPTHIGEQFIELENNILKSVCIAGEKINRFIPKPYNVFNVYGPTETTVQATSFLISDKMNNIPIGKPIDNFKCYVTDCDLNILPPGIPGELCIAGVGLARGYLTRSALTSEKFLTSPFFLSVGKSKKYARIYRTGDVVRWRHDGNLEYIGRKDLQVKLGGCRIELEEIEHIFSGYACIIENAVVLHRRGESHYLIAYYRSETDLTKKDLCNYLSKFLPKYMIPSLFIKLNKFPINFNGKIDRAALPKPHDDILFNDFAPENEMQSLICNAFSDVLGVSCVGLHSDFFDLGGKSAQVIKLVAQLKNNFVVNVQDVFSSPTPLALAAKLKLRSNNFKKKLLEFKNKFEICSESILLTDFDEYRKILKYKYSADLVNKNYKKNEISSVLLTGSTGYLGCNLLNQLLVLTNYRIILIIRSSDIKTAWMKLIDRYIFYFDVSFTENELSRITVVVGDLEKDYFGLVHSFYDTLAGQVDSIIHAAALVKHYGVASSFYSANVTATTRLLEFCEISNGRDFHYISTASVLTENNKSQFSIFTEDDEADSLMRQCSKNVYIRTKLEGEALVLGCRSKGCVNGTIYRVGNLAFMMRGRRLQKNRHDNAFYYHIRTLLDWGFVTSALDSVNISPVDSTAHAIVLLFDKLKTKNNMLHVFSPIAYNMRDILLKCMPGALMDLSPVDFFNALMRRMDRVGGRENVERFLLHQGWLETERAQVFQKHVALQYRTQEILRGLNFFWTPLGEDVFSDYMKNFIKI